MRTHPLKTPEAQSRASLRSRLYLRTLLASLGCAALWLWAGSGDLIAQIPERPAGYVTDLPGLLDESDRLKLESKLAAFEAETTNQIVILIAPDLGGSDEFTATFETASRWGIGQADKDNGVLIALYMAERKIRIEVGYGLEGSIPDARAARIIRNTMVPHMRDGAPYLALDGAVSDLMAASRGEFTAENEELAPIGEIFEAGYIPEAWLEWEIPFVLFGAAMLLLVAFTGGFRGRFDRSQRAIALRFSFSDFFAELIALPIVLGIFPGLPIGLLYFILEENNIHGYPLILIGPTIVLLFWLYRLLSGKTEEIEKIRESLSRTATWRKLEKKYDAAATRELHRHLQRRLKQWRPTMLLRNALPDLRFVAENVPERPEKYLPFDRDYCDQKLEHHTNDDAFWEGLAAQYDAKQLEATRADFTERYASLQSAPTNSGASAYSADELLKEIQRFRKKPQKTLDYKLEIVREKLADFIENDRQWAKWKARSAYSTSRVTRMRKRLHTDFAKYDKLEDSRKRVSELNDLLRDPVKKIQANPGKFFNKPTPSSGSSYSSSSVYSSGSSYSSSASFSTSSSFSSGGGSFGGGGASGSW